MRHKREWCIVNDLFGAIIQPTRLGPHNTEEVITWLVCKELSRNFQKKESRIISATIENTEDVLRTSVCKVKAAFLSMDPDVSITPN